VNDALLELLVCPATRTRLRWEPAAQELISDAAGVAYPVRDGVPVMLVEEARLLNTRPKADGDHPEDGGGVCAPKNDFGC
jgi:uncharacterized protein YbaR (Trm112 family)